MPNDDPRKAHLTEELLKREDIHSPDEIWERAVSISIHGGACPISRTCFLC